jgi:uncharacterized integral membrane protein
MSSAKRPVLDGTTLRQRLAGLRRRMRLVATVRGVGFLLAVVLATAAVAGLLDWHWHLPALVRAVILVATLAGGILVAYRYLLRPLCTPSDDLSLALRVEEAYPTLNDALASTVQFLEREAPAESSSASLEREAVKRALARASGCDFGKVVDRRGLVWAAGSGGVATALAGVLILLAPALALTALLRLANPFGEHDWPKKTQLEIDPPRLRIGRNEAFEVRGLVRGVIPPQATIVFRFEGFPNLEHHCDIKMDEAGVGHLASHLEPGRVQRNFRFQVRANDAVSQEYRVEVLPPPSLVALDSKPSPQLQLHYPAYTGLPSPDQLSPGTGNIDAVAGTAVRLRARADRPLKRAWIEYQPEAPSAVVSAFLAPLGGTNVIDTAALGAGSRAWWANVPAVLDEDRCTFTIDFTPAVNGMYALHFEDESGLRNSRLFELRLHPDPAPTVNLERPSPSRDILAVLPSAELTLEVMADDPQYALRSVFLEYRTQRDEQPRRLPLYNATSGPAPLLALWTGPALLAAPPMPLRPRRLEFRQKLPLKSLRHADGSSLKEEDVVLLRACADDFDDASVRKEPGRSHEVEIRIVGRNALDLALNQEQANIQQELVRLRETEREALRKVTEVESRLKKGEKPTPEDQEKLLQAEQLQQQIRERVGDEKEGLRAELKRIRETLKQNGMEKTAVQERMNDVSREMDRLAENELQQIEPRLTNARKLAELLEEKVREERKAQLEGRAKEGEREARGSEEAANRKDQEAAQAEKRAEQSTSDADKARHRQDARLQREAAKELRQKAREQWQQAERVRREAAQAPDPNQPRRALAEARKAQEEVEKTLDDLLTRRLEPWTSSHEIKGEANRLLEDQKRLEGEIQKLTQDPSKKDSIGKSPDKLTREQRAELEDHKEAQQKLEERTRQLLDKMDRVAKDREQKDPETARELRDALDQAQQDNISEKMKDAREQIEQNRLNEAQKSQRASIETLKQLVKNLEDKREAELDRLAKKLREKERELAELIQEQEQLQKKVKKAGQIGDKAQREEELKRLARKQKELQQKTEEMVRQLTRMRAARAGQSLGKAGDQMEGAGQQMAGGKQAEDEQDEALDRLNEAERELERARKEAEEELGREQITRLAEMIRPLKERQEALKTETDRFQKEVQRKARWDRLLKGDFLRKRDAQKGLAAETEDVAAKRLTGAPVFARLMRRASEAMTEAGQRMETVAKEAVDPAELPDAETARLQQQALRRLNQVIDALKDAAEKMQQAKGGRGGAGGEGGDGGSGGAPGDGIPPLAQLKLLRDLQKDINQRTETFKKEHPDPKKLEEKDRGELRSIRNDQQDVAELLDELTRPAGEPGAVEGEKKK